MSIDLEERVRRLERRVVAQRVVFGAAAIVALVFACRSSSAPEAPTSLKIGSVTIDTAGIKIADDMGSTTIGGGAGVVTTSAFGSTITIQNGRIVTASKGASATLTATGAASLALVAGTAEARMSVDPAGGSVDLKADDSSSVLVSAKSAFTAILGKNGNTAVSMFARNGSKATIDATFDKHDASISADATTAHATFDK